MMASKSLPNDQSSSGINMPALISRERPVFSHQGWLSRVVLGCAAILMLCGTGIMVLEGLSRHFFGVSYFWAEESVRYLMVWSFFLTLGIAGFQNYHIVPSS